MHNSDSLINHGESNFHQVDVMEKSFTKNLCTNAARVNKRFGLDFFFIKFILRIPIFLTSKNSVV